VHSTLQVSGTRNSTRRYSRIDCIDFTVRIGRGDAGDSVCRALNDRTSVIRPRPVQAEGFASTNEALIAGGADWSPHLRECRDFGSDRPTDRTAFRA
jgi:hypothetical protein